MKGCLGPLVRQDDKVYLESEVARGRELVLQDKPQVEQP